MIKSLFERYRSLDHYDKGIVHLGVLLCVLAVALVFFEFRAVNTAREWAMRERERVYAVQDSCKSSGLVPYVSPFIVTGEHDE